MTTREYRENGDGFRVRATKRSWHNAEYEVTAPPKKRMSWSTLSDLQQALARARQAMGES